MKIPRNLLEEAIDALERSGCRFLPCNGPERRPVFMVTCIRCRSLRNLKRALDRELKKARK